MPKARAIRTDAEYRAVLERIDDLLDADLDSPEGAKLLQLIDRVEQYEDKYDLPTGLW